MDLTSNFLQLVATAKTSNSEIEAILSEHESLTVTAKTKKNTRKKDIPVERLKGSTFAAEARCIVDSITKLRDYLEEFRSEYLSRNVFIARGSGASMTDADRDRIDSECESLIQQCMQLITKLKRFPGVTKDSEKHQHYQGVLHLVEEYLKQVCDRYSEMRAFRVSKSVEQRKLSKLEGSVRYTSRRQEPRVTSDKAKVASLPSHPVASLLPEQDLSPEEQQALQLENDQLANELRAMEDQVGMIEGQVMEISRLQSIFTEKVLTQSAQIDTIHTTAVTSTENVKQGNEQIREAMRNNTGLRFWILFFLLVCSFSLLFLDWYDQ